MLPEPPDQAAHRVLKVLLAQVEQQVPAERQVQQGQVEVRVLRVSPVLRVQPEPPEQRGRQDRVD